ncbi:hypothetical protein HY993_01060 [Candidatus Micrarchaeota archaeon]|nr:hypothetical protein [Candidatus Micrarchaeota archaeon]
MDTVIDSSSLIFLFKSPQLLGLVKIRFSKLLIPAGVFEEVVVKGMELGKPGAQAIGDAIEGNFFKICGKTSALSSDKLGKGESQGLFIAKKLSIPLICDDLLAYKMGVYLGVTVIPLSSLILWGEKNKHFSKTAAIRALDELVGSGYYLKTETYLALRREILEN